VKSEASIDCFLETIDYHDQFLAILATNGHDNRLITSINRLFGLEFEISLSFDEI